MTPLRIAVALSLSLALGACGKDDENPPRPLDLQTFTSRAADTVCSALVDCSCADASALQDCRTAYTEMLTLELAETVIRYPGVKVDPTGAQACLTEMAASLKTCPSPTGSSDIVPASMGVARAPSGFVVEACDLDALMVGTQAEGEWCGHARGCAAGLACDRSSSTCVPAAGAGESCEGIGEPLETTGCQPGLYCDEAWTCVAIPGEGEPCAGYYGLCAGGTTCFATGEAVYTCVAPQPVDEPCMAGCVAGAYCATDTMTCQPFLADGADCVSDYQCAHGWCGSDQKCADPGFCGSFYSER